MSIIVDLKNCLLCKNICKEMAKDIQIVAKSRPGGQAFCVPIMAQLLQGFLQQIFLLASSFTSSFTSPSGKGLQATPFAKPGNQDGQAVHKHCPNPPEGLDSHGLFALPGGQAMCRRQRHKTSSFMSFIKCLFSRETVLKLYSCLQ